MTGAARCCAGILNLRLALPALACLGLASAAFAHEREFTRSRDWFLPYQGEHELEWRAFFDTSGGPFLGQLEYEYGVTDHFAIEPGLELKEKDDHSFEIEGAELELRFNFGEFAPQRWLPAFNLEYEHPFEDQDGEEAKLEGKFVLSRYGLAGQDFTVNLNIGRELSGEKATESEITAGFVQPIGPLGDSPTGWHTGLRAGLEVVWDLEEQHTSAGPLLVHRLSKHANFLVSYTVGIDEREENHDLLSVIVEWEF